MLRDWTVLWFIPAVIPYLTLVILVEHQINVLRSKADHHKAREAQAFALFQKAEAPEFLVDSSLLVLELNASAYLLTHNHGVKDPYGQPLSSLFPAQYAERLGEMVQAAQRGEVEQEEMLLHEKETAEAEGVALLVTAEAAQWQQKLCAKVTCLDVTAYVARRVLVESELQTLHKHASALAQSVDQAYTKRKELSMQDHWQFHSLLAKLRGALVLQRHFIGALHSNDSDFNLSADIHSLVEVSAFVAQQRTLDVKLTLDENLPEKCRGDRLKSALLFKAICDFAMENACIGSELQINLKLESRTCQSIKLSLGFAFSSMNLTGTTVKTLFLRPRSQRQFAQLASVIAEHGIGIAVHSLVLEALGGSMVDAYVQDGTSCKIVVTYMLPFAVAEERVTCSACTARWNFQEQHRSLSVSPKSASPEGELIRKTRNSLMIAVHPPLFEAAKED